MPPARCSISSHQEGSRFMAEKDVATFMDDPMGYFDRSVTKMHRLPRAELAALQRAAMARRFAQHRERIEIVQAAHPVPDAAGLQAAERIRALVSGLTADDLRAQADVDLQRAKQLRRSIVRDATPALSA